jgi:hypothetical protein
MKLKCTFLQISVARTQQFVSSLDERKPFLQQITPYTLYYMDIIRVSNKLRKDTAELNAHQFILDKNLH